MLTPELNAVFNSGVNTSSSLDRAADIVGSQAALAKALGVTPMAISHWKSRGVPVPRCKAIEELTHGAVQRHELRPDIFDPPATAAPVSVEEVTHAG